MRNLVLLLTVALLGGCLGKMERITEETKESVQASNKLIDETKNGQALGEALNLMSDRTISGDLRVAASETVFTKGADERIWKYVGMPAPLDYPRTERVLDGKIVQFANVTLISDKVLAEGPQDAIDKELGVPMKDLDLYAIQSFAALNLLGQLANKAKTPGLTATDLDYLRATTLRMIPVATGLLGGVRVSKLKEALRAGYRDYEQVLPTRRQAAKLIMELSGRLSLTEEQVNAAKIAINERLGVSAE